MRATPILRVITRLNVGGPTRQALLLTEELSESYPTTLVAGSPQPDEGELPVGDVDVTRVPLARPLHPINDVRSLARVRRLIASTRSALVHTHMAKAGFIGRTAARMSTPSPVTVHTFHGHVLEGYFRPATERIFAGIERTLARRTDALVAVSEEVRDSLLGMDIGHPDRFHVIPLGFDLRPLLQLGEEPGLLRKSVGISDDVLLVGTLGRLTGIKDHHTLLEAISRVPDVHLAVLGDGELRSDLERLCGSLCIKDRVHFTGWWLDVPSALADLDMVALTSRNEGTPVSLIEASAAALPVVGTSVGGVPSVVRDGETGFLVRPGDPEEVAIKIERLAGDRELRRAMGARGREHVRNRFSKERLVSEVSALYDDLLSSRRLGGLR